MDEHISKRLKGLVDSLTEMANHVHKLKDGEDSRRLLQTDLNHIIEQMKELEQIAGENRTEVPLSLLDAMDKGSHPDFWFRQQLDSLSSEQKKINAKAKAIGGFREILLEELGMDSALPSPLKSDDPDEDIVID